MLKSWELLAAVVRLALKELKNQPEWGAMKMKRTIPILAALVVLWTCLLRADYGVESRGTWPKDWPKELEPLRVTSQTLEGPKRPLLHYSIPFTNRDEFEAAWPYLLKVKSRGAQIILRRGPSFWLRNGAKAGVCIHTPPLGEAPIPDADAKTARESAERTIYIELIVDGEIIDLNRIALPADTPFSDERFKESKIK